MATWSVAFSWRVSSSRDSSTEKGWIYRLLPKSNGGEKKTGRIINVFAEIFKALLTNLLMLFMTGRRSGFRNLHRGRKGDQSQRISGTFLKTTHYLTAAEKWRGMFPRHHVHLCGTIVHSGGHVRAQHEPEQRHPLKSFRLTPSPKGHTTLSKTQWWGALHLSASPTISKNTISLYFFSVFLFFLLSAYSFFLHQVTQFFFQFSFN